ncbi:MAG: hypothetical protein H6715_01755 [Myxococcales bacterium]|nr:hypothetical protein [Myxococcales bacterium]MCB9707587.1 hypothetical protein [Myxococcales bacterium]
MHSYHKLAVVLLLLPCMELAWLAYARAHVATLADWQRVANVVRRDWQSTDGVKAFPSWTDPLLREVLGDLIPIGKAARSDNAGLRRMWVLSRGYVRSEVLPEGSLELDRPLGSLRVRRWKMRTPRKRYDFLDHVGEATVSLYSRQGFIPCSLLRGARPMGGGLLNGPMAPEDRFRCDARRHWLWVGATVVEDLAFKPRNCIWQHAAGPEPIRITFRKVPLTETIVLYGGLYHMHERDLKYSPVAMQILFNEVPVARFDHRDGEGWRQYIIETPWLFGQAVDVTVDVTAPMERFRGFCWSGYVRENETVD